MTEPPGHGGLPPDFCREPGHRRVPVGTDVGDVAAGHRFIVRGICLFDDQLTVHYAWMPGLTVDYGDTEGKEQYAAPGAGAREVYLGFFRPDYEYDYSGGRRPDYLANRVSRLTVNLATGHAALSQ